MNHLPYIQQVTGGLRQSALWKFFVFIVLVT